jgi:hypothetical protein
MGITENEWNSTHPALAEAYVKAWRDKQEREDARLASLQLVICQAQGVKISGRQPTLKDFMPNYSKGKKASGEFAEAKMKVAMMMMAARSKKKKD